MATLADSHCVYVTPCLKSRLPGNVAQLSPAREYLRPALPAPVAEGLVHDGELVRELDLGLHMEGGPIGFYLGSYWVPIQ